MRRAGTEQRVLLPDEIRDINNRRIGINHDSLAPKLLKEAVMRAYKNIKHNTLTINNKSHMQSFSLDDILYIEIMNKTASFHLTGERLSKANVSIQEIMQKLPSESFVQCHRSYLVNIAKIFSIKRYEITLCDGKTIPVSKRNYCNVQNAILRWSEEL